jgi:hypothetical protein
MRWYRAFEMSDDGKTVTMRDGVAFGAGLTGTPSVLAAVDQKGMPEYFSTAMTSGTNYGDYVRLDVTGTGVEGIAGRFKTTITTGTAANLYGLHATVETGATGKASGQTAGIRANLVLYDRAITGAGRYYGLLAEIYPNGNVSALTTENAIIGLNAQPGTEMDKVVNAFAIYGTDSSTSMIYTKGATCTFTGYIRITVNGAIRYIPFTSTTG